MKKTLSEGLVFNKKGQIVKSEEAHTFGPLDDMGEWRLLAPEDPQNLDEYQVFLSVNMLEAIFAIFMKEIIMPSMATMKELKDKTIDEVIDEKKDKSIH